MKHGSYNNPGTAGSAPGRFGRPQTVCLLRASDSEAARLLLDDAAEALLVYGGASAPRLIAGDKLQPADAFLLACEANTAVPLTVPAAPRPAQAAQPLYALVACPAHSTQEAAAALDEVAAACRATGYTWAGGVAVAGSRLVASTARTPRMGWLRRGRSEAADRMLLQLLAGRPFASEVARCPVPGFVYRRLVAAGRI